MLICHYWSFVVFTWGQFHRECPSYCCPSYCSVYWDWHFYFKTFQIKSQIKPWYIPRTLLIFQTCWVLLYFSIAHFSPHPSGLCLKKKEVFFIANWFWACFNIISANEKCCFLYKSFSDWLRLSCHKKGRCWSVFSINLIYQIPNSITFPTNDDLCSYINTYIMTSLIFSRCLMQVYFHKFIFADWLMWCQW